MPTTSKDRRIAATFQCGRDPDQDQIVDWLKTLPVNNKGMVERSVMKYHITRALLLYIQSGNSSATSGVSVKSVQTKQLEDIPVLKDAVSQVSTQTAPPVVNAKVPTASAVTSPVAQAPVSTTPSAEKPPAPVATKPSGAGSLLRKKIAQSMSSGS